MITLSAIKADIGGYPGHASMHPDLMAEAQGHMERARGQGLLVDFHVSAVQSVTAVLATSRDPVLVT